MERAKHLVVSAFKAPFGQSRQSKLQGEAEAIRTPQLCQHNDRAFTGSELLGRSELATTTNSRSRAVEFESHSQDERPSRFFPSELPPRPPKKQARVSLMKRRKAPVDDSLAAQPLPLSPPLSTGSSDTIDFTLTSDASSQLTYTHSLERLTPPPSPPFPRKTSARDGFSFSLRPTSSSPSLHTPPYGCAASRTQPPVLVHKPPSPERPFPLSRGSSAQTPSTPDISSDPLAEKFARLRPGHFAQNPPPSSISSNSRPPKDHSTPIGEALDTMGPSRTIRRRAIRESTEPYADPSRSHIKQTSPSPWERDLHPEEDKLGTVFHQTNSYHNRSRSTSQNNSSPSSPSVNVSQNGNAAQHHHRTARRSPWDDVLYPDLRRALGEGSAGSRSPTLSPEPLSRPSSVDRRAAAIQEQRDRELAERLQQEEDEAYDKILSMSEHDEHDDTLFERLRNASRSSPSLGLSRLSRNSLTPSTRRTSQQSGHRGTMDDPIEIDSDSDGGGVSIDWDRQQDVAAAYSEPMLLDDDSSDNESTQMGSVAIEVERSRPGPTSPRRPNPPVVIPRETPRELPIRLRDCMVCGDSTPIADLPALANCEHEPETCPGCFASWIATELENKGWRSIKCPGSECRIILAHHEVQQYAAREVFDKYDNFAMRAALSDEPNFQWCRANCGSGQIHVSGEERNIFKCIGCGQRVCVIHENTWHEGETCKEYDYRVSGQKERDQKAQEEASMKAIGKLSKKCPGQGCNFNIEKNGGCDHMTCSRCRYEFCWVCLADYNDIRRRGNAAHGNTCKYHSSRIN